MAELATLAGAVGGMNGHGDDYVTDVTYPADWYRQQSPSMMTLASVIGGVAASFPAGDDHVALLELGCGVGYGAMALAASNPSWSVTGVDLNPDHIAEAQAWAAEAGLSNVSFVKADLSTWEDHPVMRALPEMDFVTMHGLWSWVPPPVRSGVIRLLGEKVRRGGLVHLSYNLLPGWQDRLGAVRIIRDGGHRVTGRSDRQGREGLRLLKDLAAAKAPFASGPSVMRQITSLEAHSDSYIAHEYMNADWSPFWFADVATALGEAGLDWVSRGDLTDNLAHLTLTKEQQEICDRYDDANMRETIKDMCLPRLLRHDVFSREGRRMSASERVGVLMNVCLTLTKRHEDLPTSIETALGRGELNQAIYSPIVRALGARPTRLGDLLALPELAGRGVNPAEVISILITLGMVEPTSRPMAPPGTAAMRFNTVARRRLSLSESPNRIIGAACYPTGIPVATTLLAMVVMDFLRQGVTDIASLIQVLGPSINPDVKRNAIERCLDVHIPVLKAAGVF